MNNNKIVTILTKLRQRRTTYGQEEAAYRGVEELLLYLISTELKIESDREEGDGSGIFKSTPDKFNINSENNGKKINSKEIRPGKRG